MNGGGKGGPSPTYEEIREELRRRVASYLGVSTERVDIGEPFVHYGIDSAEAVGMSGEMEEWLGRSLSPTLMYDHPNIESMARYLAGLGASEEETAPRMDGGTEPIAIVGMGCRFPGAGNVEEFWGLLESGRDAIREVPSDRWNVDDYYDQDTSAPGKMNTRWGGFLEEIDCFDAPFFKLTPREAARMDPQQRLFLEVAWEALEGGGQPPLKLAGSRTGVFVGVSTHDYSSLQLSEPAAIDAFAGTGNAHSIVANRLSYLLNLTGPSMAVDTACSSSLVALHLACQSLRSGESELAIAGGVNLILSPNLAINFTKAGVMASDGRCKTFDARADGYVRGEGAGAVLLKPLSKALADGDRIYSVILGSAVNQDGRSNGLMAPNGKAQEAVLREAYRQAGISPKRVDYVEAHGTGTALGDPIEVRALGAVRESDAEVGHPCRVGSVKTNIGHLEAAAGIAGVIKVALSIWHGRLPASLHYKSPNPHIPFEELGIQVQREAGDWPSAERIAGVSSFGFGGTNGHVVLAGQNAQEGLREREEERSAYLLPLSAKTPEALKKLAESYRDRWDQGWEDSLKDICYTAARGRDHHDNRLAVVGATPSEMVEGLEMSLSREAGSTGTGGRSRTVFVFPGQGPQWLGMGRQLYREEPVFREMVDRCGQLIEQETGWSLSRELWEVGPEESRLQETAVTQPVLFSIQMGLVALWRSRGIEPEAVAGHSMGEVAAACVSGALSLEEGIRVIVHRGLLMQQVDGKGRMAAVELSEEEALKRLQWRGYEDRVSIAAVNGPDSVVISGDASTVEQLVESFDREGIFCRKLRVNLASHSPHMDHLKEKLVEAIHPLSPSEEKIAFYSSVEGAQVGAGLLGAAYWGRNLREPVRFAEALATLREDGYDTFVEMSPHPTLIKEIDQFFGRGNVTAVSSLQREDDEQRALLEAVGKLYEQGYPVDWDRLIPEGETVSLPLYPWQRERHWFERKEKRVSPPTSHPCLWDQVTDAASVQAEWAPLDLDLGRYPVRLQMFSRLTNSYMMKAFEELDIIQKLKEVEPTEDLLRSRGILPVYKKLVDRWLKRLQKDGLLDEGGNRESAEPLEEQFSAFREQFPELTDLLEYIRRCGENLPGVLKGDINPLELYFTDGSFDTAEMIYSESPEARYFNSLVQRIVEARMKESGDRKVRVLEIGAGTGGTSRSVLPVLPRERTEYLFTDVSEHFLARAKQKFNDYPFVEYRLLDIEKDPMEQGLSLSSFDIVIAANVLHATKNLEETLKYVHRLLSPQGLMVLWEVTDPQPWFDITFGLIEGWQRFDDGLREDSPLIQAENWKRLITSAQFSRVESYPAEESQAGILGQHILVAEAEKMEIPPVMPPSVQNQRNGDRESKRPVLRSESEGKTAVSGWIDHIQEKVAEVIGVKPSQLALSDPLHSLGLDSLMAVELRSMLEQSLGVRLGVGELLKGASIQSLAEKLEKSVSDPVENSLQKEVAASVEVEAVGLETRAEDRYEPFPLNDIQQAYWLGRSQALELGNVSTQLYIEFEGEKLDLSRLEEGWNQLVKRHDMLRAVIHKNGSQKIWEKVPRYRLDVQDLRGFPDAEIQPRLNTIREQMSRRIRAADQWPLFEIRAHRLDGGRTRIHFAIDFLIADAKSLAILLEEWGKYYRKEGQLSPLRITFRDYIMSEESMHEKEEYQKSLAYWQERIKTLPSAPELPLARQARSLDHPLFNRYSDRLRKEEWAEFKKKASAAGITPSMVLCAAYAEVLQRWSATPRFTLNVTLFNREPIHPDVNRLVGDFTALNLLEVDGKGLNTFAKRAQKLQDQLFQDMEHSRVSGIRVLRELSKHSGDTLGATMPVVFTSVLEDFKKYTGWLGEQVYSISQTPQVWLDHQVYLENESLVLVWDVVEELFPAGMIREMFQVYVDLLKRLCRDSALWQNESLELLPETQKSRLQSYNQTERPRETMLLHEGFMQQAELEPDRLAVITSNRRFTYGEMDRQSKRLGHILRHRGVQKNELVAIVMEKGWEQVTSVLGILQSGAAYLPVDPALPRERLHYLLEESQASIVLTQKKWNENLTWPDGIQKIVIDEHLLEQGPCTPLDPIQTPEDLAYVIFTSGSTGFPKGVMIDHRGSMNTIQDINERYGLQSDDKVLALSSLHFDLSVYDLFGPLSAGGSIVIPDADKTRDPGHWIEMIDREEITVWNSVPALMDMLVKFIREDRKIPPSLRLVMLSGDWIPLSLPKRIRQLTEKARVVSLGGATEASIWSILYPIDFVDPSWKSIPYGRPMANQRIYVLNDSLEPCPQWVPGEIYIGGIGVAKGYWRDEEKTNAHFFNHPVTGERLYRTGDMGRMRDDGNIEFLGRTDLQVKIQGHRIELGEVEHALRSCEEVDEAVVSAVGEPMDDKRLAAYIIPKKGVKAEESLDSILTFLQKKLPSYMMPKNVMFLERFQLTANGKVDRKALPSPESEEAVECIPPRSSLEKKIVHIWRSILNKNRIGIRDNFFSLGGNSINSIQVVVQMQKAGYEVSPQTVFDNQTVEALAAAVERMELSPKKGLHERGRETDRETDMGRNRSIPESAVQTAEPLNPIKAKKIFLTGATGFLGIYLLRELLQETEATVECLVRAQSPEKAMERLRRQWTWYFGENDWDDTGRVTAVPGDLSRSRFGLEPKRFEQLSREIDVIFHAAADVRHFGEYDHFYAVNVKGVEQILSLLRWGKEKSLHHVSTVGVRGTSPGIEFREGDLDVGQQLDTPYARTKFLAEKAVRKAMESGSCATIHRVGFVAADSHTGKFQQNIDDNAMYRYMKAILHMGVAPYLPAVPLDFIPVNYVAQAIVAFAGSSEWAGKTTHLVNPVPIMHYDLIRSFQALGYPIRLMQMEDYTEKVFTLSESELYQRELKNIIQFRDINSALVTQVNSVATQNGAQKMGLKCPPPDTLWIERFLTHAIEVGYIRPPHLWNPTVATPVLNS